MNSPEAPKDEQTRVDISKRIGAGEDPRALVEAEAQGRDLDVAAAKARIEAFKKKSPQQYEILRLAPAQFSRRKDNTEFPFAHGRTLNAMVKAGLVTVTVVSSKVSLVEPTDEGRKLLGKPKLEVVQATVPETLAPEGPPNIGGKVPSEVVEAMVPDPVLESAASAPLDDEPTTPADLAALADSSPPIPDADVNWDDAPPDGATARDVWLRLAMKWGNTPRVVEDLFGQYLRHFPTG